MYDESVDQMQRKWTLICVTFTKLFFLQLMHSFDFFELKTFRQVAHYYFCQQDFKDTMYIYVWF